MLYYFFPFFFCKTVHLKIHGYIQFFAKEEEEEAK